MEDEVVIVKATLENFVPARLEVIRQTYNNYAEKVNDNPKWTINMTAYCQDVYLLLNVIKHLEEVVAKNHGKDYRQDIN